MVIKVLGTGCPKCKKQIEEAKKAVEMAGVDAVVEKVEDINDIMSYGVMMTPALVINDKVKASGKIVSADKIIEYLKD